MQVTSRIEGVVVHPGAAVVTRVAEVEISSAGALVLTDLPLGLLDDSVQVAIAGPAVASAARIAIELAAAGPTSTAEAELDAATDDHAALTAEGAAVAAALAALAELAPVAAPDEAVAPDWAAAVTARLELVELARTQGARLRDSLRDLDVRLATATRTLDAAGERWRARASTERIAGAMSKTIATTVTPVGAGGTCTVTCRYLVPGARWAPTYVARFGDDAARLEVRAVVCQTTGEDWAGVAMRLSTAAPLRRVELPVLPALRIGRAQPAPARAGWRAPPVGVDDLYRDFDQGFGPPAPAPAARPAPPAPAPKISASYDEDADELADLVVDGAPGSLGELAASRMMAPGAGAGASLMKTRAVTFGSVAPARRSAPTASKRDRGALAAGDEPPEIGADDDPPEVVAADELLDYGGLRMAGPDHAARGLLRRRAAADLWPVAGEAVAAIEAWLTRRTAASERPLPPDTVAPAPGQYDYAWTTGGPVDVAADGAWHAIAVAGFAAPVAITHVVTPAVAPEVYRVATLTNPDAAPLLAGPVDVYRDDELVLTARLDETPPGGAITIGLGVDPDVKVARNARFREESAGVLRGSNKLIHDVTVDVEVLGRSAVTLQVRERVPIPGADTDEVEVALHDVVPAWEPYRPEPAPGQRPLIGGHRWTVTVDAGQRASLRYSYVVKIAAKHELVGGNRREP